MKIGIFGDSFGFQKSDQLGLSWVDLLEQQHDIENYCQCGVSEYKILKQLTSVDLSQFQHLIITHTSYSRIFVDHNPIHQQSKYHQECDILLSDVDSRTDEFSTACKLYFKYIFNFTYAKDIHNLILKEINDRCRDYSVIHMTNFDHDGLFPFQNLLNFHELFLSNRGDINHYDAVANKIIYKTVADRLDLA